MTLTWPLVDRSLGERGLRESYRRELGHIVRSSFYKGGLVAENRFELPSDVESECSDVALYEVARLRSTEKPRRGSPNRTLRVVDAFSGCGGLSLGFEEAAFFSGSKAEIAFAFDNNNVAMEVYRRNFSPKNTYQQAIEDLIDRDFNDAPSKAEAGFKDATGEIDMVIGGPPCQGNSDLNNHSRRNDPKNALYARMGRLAEILDPRALIIENVPGAVHDRSGVVQRTQAHLIRLDYSVLSLALRADDFGAAQRRKRHFTLAIKGGDMTALMSTLNQLRQPPLPLRLAIGDLSTKNSAGVFDSPATHSPRNRERIAYLFEHGLYELPDAERPDCHRLKKHSYKSVYGRLYGDRPAPTITSGFGSTGQGRFVHPDLPRTLTPHEAARVQGFPDFFSFGEETQRRSLQEMIGNAVPARLAYAVSLSTMGGLL